MVKVIRKDGPAKKTLNFILKNVDGYVAKSGYFATSKYPGTGKSGAIPVAYVATIMEYGDPSHNIPPRSIFRYTVAKQRGYWRSLAAKGGKKILEGKLSIQYVLESIADQATGDMKERISTITTPPLKESTIKARRSKFAKKGHEAGSLDKPLVERGYLLNSLTYTVEKT